MGINVNGKDIMTPMVHDRHLVKFMYEYMRDNDMYKNAFKSYTLSYICQIQLYLPMSMMMVCWKNT